jgi:hypothetical protein
VHISNNAKQDREIRLFMHQVFAYQKDNGSRFVFLYCQFAASTVHQWVPGAADSPIGLILVHQVAIRVHSVTSESKEAAGFFKVTESYQWP